MPYDAVNMADWQISEEAEKNMPTPDEWAEKLGLEKEEMLPMGRLGKLDWVETRPLSAGQAAFEDILTGRAAAPKIILKPDS